MPDYSCKTGPFVCEGKKQFVTVLYNQNGSDVLQRRIWHSKAIIEEFRCPITRSGCYIDAIAASPSGIWLVTRRISGQGEWGYDVFRACPLSRVAGIAQEFGDIVELPRFSEDESRLIGGAGPGFLGGWWAHPDNDIEEPARGGPVKLGFLFVHRLPSHRVTRHELRVDLPKGWVPEDPGGQWYGPQDITPIANGVVFMPSWGVPVEVKDPVPRVIRLPTPDPSGKGLL